MNESSFDLLIKFLGATVIICAIGGLVLAGLGRQIPDAVIGLGAGSLTSLGAAFIRPPSREPQPVVVENRPNNPVPVDGDPA